jgi:hypothetical protein
MKRLLPFLLGGVLTFDTPVYVFDQDQDGRVQRRFLPAGEPYDAEAVRNRIPAESTCLTVESGAIRGNTKFIETGGER